MEEDKAFFGELYTEDSIAVFEKLSGVGYMTSPGKAFTEEFAPLLGLKEGDRVLDIGSGIGGMAFHLAKFYGADVLAVDISAAVVKVGSERAASTDVGKGNVKFEICDATQADFPSCTFDVIVMRSVLMHLPYEKKYKVVENSFRWLKPGGRLMLNDVHTIKEIPDAALQDHMKKRHWYLLSIEKNLQYLERAGYRCVTIKDKSKDFAESLTDELIQFEAKQEELLKDMPKGSFEVTLSHWKWKQEWAAKQAFGKFYILAEK